MTSNITGVDTPLQIQLPTQPPPMIYVSQQSHRLEGWEAILFVAKTVHHDFGLFNQTLAVSLPASDLEEIKSDKNVEWFEGNVRVINCSIR